ncbi:methyltransferase domain-containing protein [Virgibacillus dakarensis]|uniref:Methyltransferase n=1 Tax=Lentibacillus populi TaxID=1827502 RepID=A0A9W5X725_9BACI|nr:MULTISPECIES: class I SAM-dependent methyltransferase [Bacillaceae]MTW86900.1 methyltransferase domain-containing protein [Virgibacillus dakarensis]GGB52331.1 methyltransferase [Lentibacillus populi]
MFSYYGKLSTEVYNLTKPIGKSIGGDIEYYIERLRHMDGRVLEAGVGTGRFLIPILEQGFNVDGIDYSKDMLNVCREHCKKRGLATQLYQASLENFQLSNKYKAIVMPTGSLCLLDNREDVINVLRRFQDHLEPGGRIIIDLLLPHDFKAGEVTTEAFSLSNGEGITLERKSIAMDWINQKTVTYLKYEKWKDGKCMDTELQEFNLIWFGIEEFRSILLELGFININCSSGYVYDKYPTGADEVITFEAEVR